VVGEVLQVWFDVPILTDILFVSTSSAVVYVSNPLPTALRLCGTPNVTLSITPNSQSYQIVAYLFDVDILGIGTLISHGPYTTYNATVNVSSTAFVPLRTLCYDVPPGHSVGLGINMFSVLYQPANSSSKLFIEINTDGGAGSEMSSFLSLPYNPL